MLGLIYMKCMALWRLSDRLATVNRRLANRLVLSSHFVLS